MPLYVASVIFIIPQLRKQILRLNVPIIRPTLAFTEWTWAADRRIYVTYDFSYILHMYAVASRHINISFAQYCAWRLVTISLIPSVLRGLCRNKIWRKLLKPFLNWFALHKRKVSVEVIPLLPRFTADVSKIRASGWFHVKVVVTKTLPSSQLLTYSYNGLFQPLAQYRHQ